MKIIDESTFELYNATFVSFLYTPSNFETSVFTPPNNYEATYKKLSITAKTRNLVLVFESEFDISEFTALLIDNFILELDHQYQYHCFLSDVPEIEHIGGDIYQVSFPLYTMQKGRLVIKKLKDINTKIFVDGTYKCPCKYDIFPKAYIYSLIVDGHTIKGCVKGTHIVLDGMSKKCTQDGVNKFNDLILKDGKFPYLEMGERVISINSLDADISVSYYPIYL